MKKAVALLLGTGLSLVSGAALAQQWGGTYQAAPPPARSSGVDNIGEEMQFVFGVDRVMGVSWDSYKVEPDGGGEITNSATTIALFGSGGGAAGPTTNIPRLALDFFPVESFSIGGSLIFISQSTEVEDDTSSADTGSSTTFAIAPRVGYAYAIDETFSIWPRLGITYWTSSSDNGEVNDDESSANGLAGTLEVMFGISPMSNFAILLGPYVDLGLSGSEEQTTSTGTAESDSKLTSFGLAVSVVGYY